MRVNLKNRQVYKIDNQQHITLRVGGKILFDGGVYFTKPFAYFLANEKVGRRRHCEKKIENDQEYAVDNQ